ncbi:sialate O-acetylesterase, partial [Escherichia coli]
GDAARVPWVCGDTTFWWKQQYPTQYSLVYGAYRKNSEPNVHFVELMKDETGVNVPTNNPAEDPDVPEANYYGAASRTAGNWTNPTRAM